MSFLRTTLIAAAGVAAAALIVTAIVVLGAPRHPDAAGRPDVLPRFATAAPLVRATTPAGPGVADLADPGWVATTAKATGIPARALRSYAGVAIAVADAGTGCGIGWNTLAGIGEIESRHGTIFGGTIAANGDATPAIFGVPLAGGAVANIPDSDKGAIDGDPTIDRAVGPMQMIPEAWRNWHVDANLDGVENPQNLDDATLAAAHYLCRAGGQTLGTEVGWRRAVLAYNGSDQYLADVIRYSFGYGKAAAPTR
jgi:membrane-bound lytic murein transglycosylase B